MRAVYRTFVNRVGTNDALALAHHLLGFAPDGHPEWPSVHSMATSVVGRLASSDVQ